MRDVIIKLTKKGSEEHSIYEDLLHCSELLGKDFQGVLPPVAILDSQHDFAFVVMPRCAQWFVDLCMNTHVVQMGGLQSTRHSRDSWRNLDPDAMFAQGEDINGVRDL